MDRTHGQQNCIALGESFLRLKSRSMLSFSWSLLPRANEKRPMRLRWELEIEGHSIGCMLDGVCYEREGWCFLREGVGERVWQIQQTICIHWIHTANQWLFCGK